MHELEPPPSEQETSKAVTNPFTTPEPSKASSAFASQEKSIARKEKPENETSLGQYQSPFSSSSFIERITRYLRHELKLDYQIEQLQPTTASKTFSSLRVLSRRISTASGLPSPKDDSLGDMPRDREDFFLNLFWQSYHCVCAILNEADFRQYYDSLWSDPFTGMQLPYRKASPLADIILAVCMQYGTSFMAQSANQSADMTVFSNSDSSIAGHFFYRRCQELLDDELETPTIATLQCHLYSAIYLCNASFYNTAHNTLAVAIRLAHILGLHHEPSKDASPAEQGLHRRLWWALYVLDSQLALDLDRPSLVNMSHSDCDLPADDRETALLSGSQLISSHEEINWLSYQVQEVNLTTAVRGVHSTFYEKYAETVNSVDGKDVYEHPKAMETCATFLHSQMKIMEVWVANVPDQLKNTRQSGKAFSIQRSQIELSHYTPIWVQRQRIILELRYHHYCMLLFRPFLRFPPVTTSLTPLSDGHTISCLKHAEATTTIIHQMLTESEVLNGWHQTIQLLWDATLCIFGFIIANQVCPPTPSARKTLQIAIAAFDLIAPSCMAASSAAKLARGLSSNAGQLIGQFQSSFTHSRPSSVHPSNQSDPGPPLHGPSFPMADLSAMDISLTEDQVAGMNFDPKLFSGSSNELAWLGQNDTILSDAWNNLVPDGGANGP